MLPSVLRRYIAAGCLVVDKAETGIPDGVWSLASAEPNLWLHFGPFRELSDHEALDGTIARTVEESPTQNGLPNFRFLDQELQHHLLASCLASYADLLRKGWVHVSPCLSSGNPGQAIFRVYVLPDDVDNRAIPRSDSSLWDAKSTLLTQLDYSRSTWHGEISSSRSLSPSPSGTSNPGTPVDNQDGEGQSLLQMFNSIPSPNPNPDNIRDYDARDAARRLMSSSVPGLKATLYLYQRRSAALMLQRESQSQRVLDPRLVEVVDQLGTPWYYDAVEGTSLREPRRYDAPCGGILAEEMGAGKTLICLALILATRHIPSEAPEHLRTDEPIVRRRVGSLADMAAACITRNSVPWKNVFGALGPDGVEYSRCVDAIRRNAASYIVPPPTPRLLTRNPKVLPKPAKVLLSHSSLVIVPANLVQQWKQEIAKHTVGLKVLIVDKRQELPPARELVEYDIVLFSLTRFGRLADDFVSEGMSRVLWNSLAQVHFKRCIVDEGHRLGNSTSGRKSNLASIIDHLHISAKWVVTGTPSKGLFGVDDTPSPQPNGGQPRPNKRQVESSADLEKDDLKRIGSIAMLYLRMRPWVNHRNEPGDSPADWAVYVMQPRHSSRSTGRANCLKVTLESLRANCLKPTLESLIIRHRLSEVSTLLPSVDEKIVYLDGSYQDKLVLNLFSMMIIFNAVQSQRTDQDYFFHPRQRKALLELVSNLRQATFFGGSFFSPAEISKAIDTADNFLKEGKLQISAEDEALLRGAIEFGRLAEKNEIKRCANLFREVPLYVKNFPFGAGREWSLDLKDGDPMCTDSRMILALQKLLHPLVDAPTSLQLMFDSGRFADRGLEERWKGIEDQEPDSSASAKSQPKVLAGNTQLGQDNSSPNKRRSSILTSASLKTEQAPADEGHETNIAAPLAQTQLVSTASVKLSYLIDQIVKYQDAEQIIVFYENDNVAYYLAGVLEILQIHHLIYAKGLTPERRAQYVATFNHNPKFRVLLMDTTQAAFGLDMQSASRIYFLSPVLNPQVEAQAIGRARRIRSSSTPVTNPTIGTGSSTSSSGGSSTVVTVETLVLRGSVDEVVLRRRGEMTQAEQWRCRGSIAEDGGVLRWVLGVGLLPLSESSSSAASGGDGDGDGDEGGGSVHDGGGEEQMARLERPLKLFGRGFGKGVAHPDQDLVGVGVGVNGSPEGKEMGEAGGLVDRGLKRRFTGEGPGLESVGALPSSNGGDGSAGPKKKVRVRFAEVDEEEG